MMNHQYWSIAMNGSLLSYWSIATGVATRHTIQAPENFPESRHRTELSPEAAFDTRVKALINQFGRVRNQ